MLIYLLLSMLLPFQQEATAKHGYEQQIQELVTRKDMANAEKLLLEWEKAEPANPEVYVFFGNYLFNKSITRKMILDQGKPSSKNELRIVDKSGKHAGRFGYEIEYDTNMVLQAVEKLRTGSTLAPNRLDIRFGIAHILQEIGDFEAQLQLLSETASYCNLNRNNIKWIGNKPLPTPVDEFTPGALREYAQFYYMKDTPEDDERYLKISRIIESNYPDHPTAALNIALYYYNKKEWSSSLQYFLKAYERNPKDSEIITNVAENYLILNHIQKGNEFLKLVIKLNNDPELVEHAKKRLKALP